MKKTNVGRAILGFLISFFMVSLLIGAGLLIGIKTTILNGSDVIQALVDGEEVDLSEVAKECLVTVETTYDEMKIKFFLP